VNFSLFFPDRPGSLVPLAEINAHKVLCLIPQGLSLGTSPFSATTTPLSMHPANND
jgi:hypothetical protein